MTVPDWVETTLATIEVSSQPLNELTIVDALNSARKSQGDLSDEDFKGFLAERAAFLFRDHRNQECLWGTYFGPRGSGTLNDGTVSYWPDIKDIDAETISYWQARSKAVRDSVMRARYSDLVWDLKKLVTAERPSPEYARAAIDAYLESVTKQRYTMTIEGVYWIERALDLALSINDETRIKNVVLRMFDLYDSLAGDGQAGTWLFLFDTLYEKKGTITPEQEKRIITNLEAKLALSSDASRPESFDPYGAEAVSQRLIRHFRRHNNKVEIERVIRTYGKSFEDLADKGAPIFAVAILGPIVQMYQQEGLKEEAEKLQIKLAEKGKNIAADMKEVSVSVEIKEEEITIFFEQLTSGGLEKAFLQVASYFVPKVEEAKKQLELMRRTAPFMSLIPIVKIEDGHPTAMIGSLDDDPDGRLHSQLGQSLTFYQPFLARALGRLRERYSPTVDDILRCLFLSPMFAHSRTDLLKEGLVAYEQADFLKAIHVLVPQIEHILRTFLALIGVPALKTVPRHPGIMDAKNMNDILDDSRMRAVLTEDLWRYLAILYVDRKGGLNLRNDLAHGLAGAEVFCRQIADQVFHSLLALSLIRTAPVQRDNDAEQPS